MSCYSYDGNERDDKCCQQLIYMSEMKKAEFENNINLGHKQWKNLHDRFW